MQNFRIILLLSLIVGFLINGCSHAGFQKAPVKSFVVFPPPPDTTRIQFLTKISNSTDITVKRSAFLRYVAGEEPDKAIQKPYGITTDVNKIYICDTMLPGLEIINLQDHTFDYFIPAGPGQLKKPLNCALDATGNLYVADAERRQVVVFNKMAEFSFILGDKDIQKPTDIFVTSDKIFVCDLEAHQIKMFDLASKKLIKSFPEPDKNRQEFLFSPTNITVSQNKVYVTDTGASHVSVFSLSGDYIGRVGSFGKLSGQFVRPKGIAVDNEGMTYVVDAAFENVQIFNAKARMLMFFGGSYKGAGNMWLPAGITIDYKNLDYYRKYVQPGFQLQYLIFVTNQYGPDRVGVYGFVTPN